jgi:hypothetical protein
MPRKRSQLRKFVPAGYYIPNHVLTYDLRNCHPSSSSSPSEIIHLEATVIVTVNKRPQEARDITILHREITSKVKEVHHQAKDQTIVAETQHLAAPARIPTVKTAIFAPIITQEDHQDSQISTLPQPIFTPISQSPPHQAL